MGGGRQPVDSPCKSSGGIMSKNSVDICGQDLVEFITESLEGVTEYGHLQVST